MTDDLERFQEYLLNTMEIAEWIRLQECFRSWYEMRRNCGIYDREFTGRVVFEDDTKNILMSSCSRGIIVVE